jgi:hypothetical protein
MGHGTFVNQPLGLIILLIGIGTQVFGIIVVLVGFALRYWVNRRRFNRRNFAGLQTFNSYEQKVTVKLFERIVKLVGLGVIAFGIFLILAGYAERENVKRYNAIPAHQK